MAINPNLAKFIRLADNVFSENSASSNHEIWRTAMNSMNWLTMKADNESKHHRHDMPDAFIAALLFLELIDQVQHDSEEQELFQIELLALAVAFRHPVIRACRTIDLLADWRFEELVWTEIDPWSANRSTCEQEFVVGVKKSSGVLLQLFNAIKIKKVQFPLLRAMLQTEETILRISDSGRATPGDQQFLINTLSPLRDRLFEFELSHRVTLSQEIVGRCADRSISDLLKATCDDLMRVPDQDEYLRDILRTVSAVRKIASGDILLTGAVMESTHLFEWKTRDKWFAEVAMASCKDADLLRKFGKSLLMLKFRDTKTQGMYALKQDSRNELKSWYETYGKGVGLAITAFRRWKKTNATRLRIEDLPQDPRQLPENLRTALGENFIDLTRVWIVREWIIADSGDILPYEIAIAYWLLENKQIQSSDDLTMVRSRARHAWRDIQPDRIKLKRS